MKIWRLSLSFTAFMHCKLFYTGKVCTLLTFILYSHITCIVTAKATCFGQNLVQSPHQQTIPANTHTICMSLKLAH